MADAVLLNDPITGQGSNNAAKGAAIYLQSILERGEGPFDAIWMQETFERLWEYASKVVGWTNALLLPPPPHVLNVLGAAGQLPAVAHRFANGFDNPPDYYEWFMDPDKRGRLPRRGGGRVVSRGRAPRGTPRRPFPRGRAAAPR